MTKKQSALPPIAMVPTKSIKLNPKNPRILKDAKFKELVKSLADFPKMLELRPIVVDEDGVVIGGNMRLKAARELKMEHVPVVRAAGLTEDQRRQFIIKDNLAYGEWDWTMLAAEWDTVLLSEWGLTAPAEEEPKEVPLPDFDFQNDAGTTEIEVGDLIEIGNHRLLCGDATDPEQVTRLMNNEKACMVFTDPPYGINLMGGRNKSNVIAGDLTQTAIPFSFELAVTKATDDEARFYFCGASNNISLYFKLFDRYLAQIPALLIWVKNGFVMKPNGYHNQYELLFYGYKRGGGGKEHWYAGRTEEEASDVWQIKRDASSTYAHPTQKPVNLPRRAIKNSSHEDGIVYEPFSGSGSTMAAAHSLGRRCYAMELAPWYCQVTVNRMRALEPSIRVLRNGVAMD